MTKSECIKRIKKIIKNPDADVEFPIQIHYSVMALERKEGTLKDLLTILDSIIEEK